MTPKIARRSGRGNPLPKCMPERFSGVYLVLRCFREGSLRKCWQFPYLVLQACISCFRCFRQEWRIYVSALFAQKKVGSNRDKLNGTNRLLQKYAVFCGFLQKCAVSCGFLQKSAPPRCYNPQEMRKSAKISENLRKKLRIWLRLSLFIVCPFYSLSLLIPHDKEALAHMCTTPLFLILPSACTQPPEEAEDWQRRSQRRPPSADTASAGLREVLGSKT